MLFRSHSKKNKSDIASSNNASGNIEMTTVPETTTSEPEVEINVCMIGDMLIHEGVYKTGLESDGSYNFDHLFANILPDLAASDMNIVNQETILGGTTENIRREGKKGKRNRGGFRKMSQGNRRQ